MRLLILTQAVDLDDPILGFFHRWIIEFAKHCDQVSVICLKAGRHELPENVSVYSLGKESGGSRLKYLTNFYRYLWTLRHEYDNVFVHMNPEYVVLGGIPWRLMGKGIALWYTHKSVTLRLRLAALLSHRILTASAESFRLTSRKVRVMGHGIPVEDFSPHTSSSAQLRVYTAGRISPTKHTKELIEAVLSLNQAGIESVFTIIGTGVTARESEYEKSLRAVYGDHANIRFLGMVESSAMPQILEVQDLCLNASATGSLDKAILEAFAAGIAVISSNEAVRQILEPHGLFVGSADPSDFCAAIKRYRSAPNKSEIVASLREYVRTNHSLSVLIPAIVRTY